LVLEKQTIGQSQENYHIIINVLCHGAGGKVPVFQSGGTSSSPDHFMSSFVVEEVTLGQIFFQILWIFSASVILQLPLKSLIYTSERLRELSNLLTYLLTYPVEQSPS
jgi:hypothetical protein